MISFLTKQGFSIVRVRGSHHAMEKGDLRTTVPLHGNEPIKIGTLRGILKDINLAPDEFVELWEKF
ncbi:MAG: hypothetical protein A3D56_02200 [Candidatus Taylorbacteria bacterium RIFCSPHIGHO2_02_FULL_45_35]|uniref:Addiction module toxin, HicA family n=1 Tax=Candidatus Taylorbacteria bacterium RIFCSPHIGHO2_02_FULL_45_35 TaxID=1802311 RepID=A0A1G2MUZ4_9BACT|nr:MAG: hypothetical protein A3D56_02200 [Candidatus Taylorbacteria bacterium RIFCSPHIGHO2_02_FULL_45_35]OHA32519.1 MAG: hypothetical protein A3A22_03215 [Candidatus Taylorbacteria bacterium RIFCSPLOWO2_01_FULL_45_34b]